MVVPCLCSFFACIRGEIVRVLYRRQTKNPQTKRSGGIFLGRHSYALGTLTESDGWRLYGLRLLIFPQPLGRALKNQNAAPASAPCFRRRRRSPPLLFEPCTVRLRRRLVDDATKKPLTKVRGSCFGGRYRTRTCDLLHVKQMLYQLS